LELRTASLAVVALCVAAGSAASQSTVRSAHLFADLRPDDGGAEVRIDYVLETQGIAPLRFELLGFGDARAEGFWLGERETGTPIRLEAEGGSMRATDFSLNVGAGPTFEFTARYWIEAAVERDGERVKVHIPVLAVALPPAEGANEVFRAELLLPEEWSVSESFPTGLSLDDDGAYSVELAVLPSVVSMRGSADGRWRPGLPLAVDFTAGLILLVFAFFGWRHLKGRLS
jgi:hypothetical protein